MSLYQIVPYLVRINVAGYAEEFRPLGDIDGTGLTLADVVSRAAHAHKGQPRKQDDKRGRTLTVASVVRENDGVTVAAETGRDGIRLNVQQHRAGETTVTEVLEDDLTLVPLRHVFVYNDKARVGLLLAERAGQHGAMTDLRALIIKTFSVHTHHLVMKITPAMSGEAMDAWAENSKVKGIEIRKVDPSTGAALLGVKPLMSIAIRAPRRQSWLFSRLGGRELTQRDAMAMVVPQIPGLANQDPLEAADRLIEDGWIVTVDLQADKKTRKVQVETKAGITLSYPATLHEDAWGQPDDADFYAACADACDSLAESFDELRNLSTRVPRSPTEWDDQHTWKAVWGEQIDDRAGAEDPT